MERMTVFARILGVLALGLTLTIGVGCGSTDSDDPDSQQKSSTEQDEDENENARGFSVEVEGARFLGPKDGEHRLYVKAKVINDAYGEDLGVNTTKLQVVTEGAGALSSGFHENDVPEEVDKCSTSNFGTPVPEGASIVCGFVVRSNSSFEPIRLRYYPRDLFAGEPVSTPFPDDIPAP